MKYILILTILFLSLYAEDKKQDVTVGLGAYIQTQPYKGIDNILVPTPIVFFDNSQFYVRWTRVGMYVLGDKSDDFSWGLSVTIQPRVYGYKPTKGSDLEGLDIKKTSLEGGLALGMSYKNAFLELSTFTDVLDRYDLWLVKAEVGYDYKIGKFSFYPSLFISYQSKNFVNYYYGVTSSEAAKTSFNEYSTDGGYQYGIQTYVNYKITDSTSALFNARVDTIADSATNSPILKETLFYSGLISLIYTFSY